MYSGRESSSCFPSGTRRVILFTHLVMNREWGQGYIMITTNVTEHPLSFVTTLPNIRCHL
jgi:hypothetical protein